MLRTQIQLPEPLFQQLKRIAAQRDWSLAELVRRGMEVYVQTCPEPAGERGWTMPVLRGSGGHLVDPAGVGAEAEAISARNTKTGQAT
jgi:hypothetical protein